MPKQGQVLMDVQAGKKSDVATHLRFQNVILSSSREGGKIEKPEVFEG